MREIKNNKEYPKQTIERCICFVGNFRSDCPYATPEEKEYWILIKTQDTLETKFNI